MKISRANTDMLKRALALNSKLVAKTDKNLYDRMKYTSDAIKKGSKVTRTDLMDLLNDVKTVLGKNFIDPVMAEEMKPEAKVETPAPAPAKAEVKNPAPKKESSLKKTTKKEAPSTDALKEAAKELEKSAKVTSAKAPAKKEASIKKTKKQGAEAPAQAPISIVKPTTEGSTKSPAKKSANKRVATPKQEPVTPLVGADSNPNAIELAKMFPNTVTIGEETYVVDHSVTKMEDLFTLFDKEVEIVLAFYWTKRHLKQFRYFNGWLGQPKSFDNDLDLATVVYVSDKGKVAHAVSMYTEGMYTLLPADIPEDEGIRYSSGMEFQIYVPKK